MQEAFDCLYFIDLDFVNKSGAIALYSLLCLFLLEHILVKVNFTWNLRRQRRRQYQLNEIALYQIKKNKTMKRTKQVLKRILHFLQTIFSNSTTKISPKKMTTLESLEAKVSHSQGNYYFLLLAKKSFVQV